MADNVTVTLGTDVDVAADEVSAGVYVQRVKLLVSTAGSTTATGVAGSPLVVDNSAQTQPISAVSLPLPTGAATLAKQPALGTAGTASADVISVQGIASMTPLLVNGSGVTQPVSLAAGAASIGKAEDVASSSGDVGVPAMAIQKASPADTAADGDYVMHQMSGGRLWTSAALEAGSAVIGHVIADTGSTTAVTGNVTVVQATSTNLKADITIAAAQTLATVTTVGTLTTLTGGGIANDSADSGNPIKIGHRALASPKAMTIITDADRGDQICDVDNIQFVKPWTSNADIIVYSGSVTDTTSTAVTGLDNTASRKNFITSITVYNSSATNTYLKLQDGSGSTTFWVIPCPTVGGAVFCPSVPLKQPTAATGLYFAAAASVSTLYVSIAGFQSKAY